VGHNRRHFTFVKGRRALANSRRDDFGIDDVAGEPLRAASHGGVVERIGDARIGVTAGAAACGDERAAANLLEGPSLPG
jgi:hypothetical protein